MKESTEKLLGGKQEPKAGDELVRFEHRGRVQSVAYSPDGAILAAGCDDRRAVLWDTATGRRLRTFERHGGGVWSVAFSADGRFLAAGCSDRTAAVWEVRTGERKWLLDTRRLGVTSVAFSPDGLFLATGCADGWVVLWDVQFGLETKALSCHTKAVWSAAFAPTGLVLATGSEDGTVCLTDVNTGKRIRTIAGLRRAEAATAAQAGPASGKQKAAVFAVAFSPDGRLIATGHGEQSGGTWRGSARLWDVETGEEVRAASSGRQEVPTDRAFEGPPSAVRSVAFSPDGSRLATGGYDNAAALWDVRTGERTVSFKGHTSWVLSVAVSPCGGRLATGSSDRTARVWLTGGG